MNGSRKLYRCVLAHLILCLCVLISISKAVTPVFQDYTPAKITEGLPPGTYYYTFIATDAGGGSVTYSLDSKGSEWFNLNSTTGVARVKKTIDREATGSILIYTVYASDSGGLRAEQQVNQEITDINDNRPVFSNLPNNISIKENTPIGSLVFTVSATDADSPPRNLFVYEIGAGNQEELFEFPTSAEGKMNLKRSLDYDEGAKQFVLRIITKDTLDPNLNSTSVLTINVLDVDDLGPKFVKKLYEATIVKDSLPGTVVTTVRAIDGDSFNDAVEYSIYQETNPDDVYKIDNRTGEIKVNGPLTIGSHVLVVTATSTKNPPTFTVVKITAASMLKMSYTVSVVEGQSDVVIFNLEPAEQFYNITGGTFSIISSAQSSLFSIDRKNLKVGVTPLDRETQDQYKLNIALVKDGSRKGLVTITVKVMDINDNTPQFVGSLPYSVSINMNSNICPSIFKVFAIDRDAGLNGTVRYSITSGNSEGLFLINNVTGHVSLKLLLDRASKDKYILTIKASDGGNPQMTNSTNLIINLKDLNRVNSNIPEPAPTNLVTSGMIIGFVILGIILALNTCLLGYIIWRGQTKTKSERMKYANKRKRNSVFSNIALEERNTSDLAGSLHDEQNKNANSAPTAQNETPGLTSGTQDPSLDPDYYEFPDEQSLGGSQSTGAPLHTYQALKTPSSTDQSALHHAYEPLHYGDDSNSSTNI